jgi:hypothetical protein
MSEIDAMWRALFVAAGLCALAACQPAVTSAPAPEPQADAQAAAASGLQTLQAMAIDQGLYAQLGFDDAEQARSAVLGEPLPVFVVGLSALSAYAAGGDANALIEPSRDAVYPVLAGDGVKSSLTIEQVEGGYRPAAFGAPDTARAVAAVQGRVVWLPPAPPRPQRGAAPTAPSPSEEAAAAPAQFIVRVPALGVSFLGARVGDQVMLAPVRDIAGADLRAGEALPAGSVFERLAPIAKATNPDEPM